MPLGQLEGYTVAVTADRRWKEQAELLARRGARVVHAPTMRTDYLTDEEGLRAATARIIGRPPDVLVATTAIGVRAWFEAAQTWGLARDLHDALRSALVVARGPKSAAALQANEIEAAVRGGSERMDEVLATLMDLDPSGKVIAIQQYGAEDPSAVEALRSAGAEVVEVPVYRWRLPGDRSRPDRLIAGICAGQIDAVTFTSAPAVRNLVALATDCGREPSLLASFNSGGVVAACVGPVCAQGAREAGIDAPVAPEVGRLGLLIRTLADELEPRRRVLALGDDAVTVQGAAVERAERVVLVSGQERIVLAALVEHAAGVVPKTVLQRRISRGGPVRGMHVVEATVARLRNRLARVGLTVLVVPKRGYRLADAA